MAELTDHDAIREQVREKYAAAARAAAANAPAPSSCCGPSEVPLTDASGTQVFGDALYDGDEAARAGSALGASLGCGVPTAVAGLHEGETVLDLGSGAGADVLISAGRVGPTGRAIGLDMTDEMLGLARTNAAQAGLTNVVLRPGGRFAISDVIADADMDEATRADMAQWTGCIAGALTREQFETSLAAAGLIDVEVRETHRVHDKAAAAIIRATKPGGSSATCCSTDTLASCCEPESKSECCGKPANASAAPAAPSSCGCSPA